VNEVLNRIHLGVMGSAICHATYGWFCGEAPEPEVGPQEVIEFDLAVGMVVLRDLER
jgi:hypothetical protein